MQEIWKTKFTTNRSVKFWNVYSCIWRFVQGGMRCYSLKKIKFDLLTLKQQLILNFVIIIFFFFLRIASICLQTYEHENCNRYLDTVGATMFFRLYIVEWYKRSKYSLYVSPTHLSTHALLAVEWIACLFCIGQVPNSTAAKQTRFADKGRYGEVSVDYSTYLT